MPIQAWSVPAVREAEAAAMALVPDGELMARAALGLASVVGETVDVLLEAGVEPLVVVLAGPGDNGGDALYAAVHLLRRDLAVSVAAVLTFARAHEAGLAAAESAGAEVVHATEPGGAERARTLLSEADVVIDGIAGIGGRSGLPPDVARLVAGISQEAHVVAVDLPSGADPEGGTPVVDAVVAAETVTFGIPKPVHVLVTAPACGRVTTVDIGLDLAALPAPAAERLVPADIAALWPVPGPDDDKYTRGVLGVVAGGENYTGAAVLCVLAAVCAGAGMVRYVGPPTPTSLVRTQVPEAVHGRPTGGQRVQAWVVGPGLDAHDQTPDGQAQVEAARIALGGDLPCLVDAGGLDLLDGPRAHAGARTLLTPHAGELARLLSRLGALPEGSAGTAEAVRADPVRHARQAAEHLHATVLLKGSTTLVVPPPGSGLPVRGQADAPPWLATAGAGDVLAGLTGMLLAAGLDPLDAGSLAALVHGLAAAEASGGGPIRAGEVAYAIPAVVRSALCAGPADGTLAR